MDETEKFVHLQVLVPRSRVAEFYEHHAQWLRSPAGFIPDQAESPPTSARPATSTRPRFDDGYPDKNENRFFESIELAPDALASWREIVREPGEWYGGTIADALNIYAKLSLGAKKIIDALLERPGEEISGENLSKQLGLSQAQLTGTLASIAIRSKAVGREVPLQYEAGADGGRYWIDVDVANLFRWARTQPKDIHALAANYDDSRRLLRERMLHQWQMAPELAEMLEAPNEIEGKLPREKAEWANRMSYALFSQDGVIDPEIWDDGTEAEFQLEREYRRAMNQPLLDKHEWFEANRSGYQRYLQRLVEKHKHNETQEGKMAAP